MPIVGISAANAHKREQIRTFAGNFLMCSGHVFEVLKPQTFPLVRVCRSAPIFGSVGTVAVIVGKSRSCSGRLWVSLTTTIASHAQSLGRFCQRDEPGLALLSTLLGQISSIHLKGDSVDSGQLFIDATTHF
jgi:hypothetical protein